MPYAMFQKPKEEELPKPKEDTRFQDYISSIKGSEMPEEKPMSNTDRVKNVLGALGTTFALGAVGGNSAMRAMGDYQDRKKAKAEKRRLEKISRAKELLGAERDIAAIKGSEKAGMLDEQRLAAEAARREEDLRLAAEKTREDQRQRSADREYKATEKKADREFESNENRLTRESHEKLARTRTSLSGSRLSAGDSDKEEKKLESVFNPVLPFVPVTTAPEEKPKNALEQASARAKDIAGPIGKIIDEFKKANVKDVEGATAAFNRLKESGAAFSRIAPPLLDTIKQQILLAFMTEEQRKAWIKFHQGNIPTGRDSVGLMNEVAIKIPDTMYNIDDALSKRGLESFRGTGAEY